MYFLSRYKEYLLFIILFFIGFLLRAEETISQNFLFLLDQGRDMLAVKSIVFEHHLTLIGPYTSLQGVFQGPLWYYLLAIPTFIFHGDPWGTVLLMLVISMLLLLICYIWMRKFFGVVPALATLFLLVISPEAIAAATYAWNPHPMWLLIGTFIFLLYGLSIRKIKYNLFLWPVISLMFHFQTALAFFILSSSIIYFLIFNRNVLKNIYIIPGGIIAFIFFLPQIFFDFRHNFLMTRSILRLFHGSDQGLFVHGEKTQYINIVQNHLHAFNINFLSSFQESGILYYFSISFLVFFILCFLFINRISFLKNREKQFIVVTGRFLLIIIFLFMFYPFPLRYWFLTGFELFYLLPIGLIFGKLLVSKISYSAAGIYVILVLLVIIPKVYTLYAHPDYGGIDKIKGKYDAIKFIFDDTKEQNFSLLIFDPPVYTDPYDYLIWFYSQNHGRNIPSKQKKGTFYLLMEPDPDKPWSYIGWLQTVVKSGKIIYSKTLPSGIIIQKRITSE